MWPLTPWYVLIYNILTYIHVCISDYIYRDVEGFCFCYYLNTLSIVFLCNGYIKLLITLIVLWYCMMAFSHNNMKSRQHLSGKRSSSLIMWKKTRTPPKAYDELKCSGKVNTSCSISDTCHFTLVTNPVISHELGKDRFVITPNWTYLWSIVTQVFRNR